MPAMRTPPAAFVAACAAVACPAAGAGPDRLRPLTVTVDGVGPDGGGVRARRRRPGPAGAAGVRLPRARRNGPGGRGGVHTDRLWPEAISVYPQGLATPGPVTDPAGVRAGWQHATGLEGDRDLHFFDALLARVEHDAAVDRGRVYCTGHSNGGGFTYLLWLNRPAVFAAVAPCSAGGLDAARLSPKPALICGGLDDPIVPFAHQRRAMETVRRVDGCDPLGQPWADGGTLYPSKAGTPVATYAYHGGHAMDAAEPGLVVRFFQEHARPTTRP